MEASPHKIRVLFAINDFIIGGAQKLIVDVLTHIDRAKFEPELVTLFQFGTDEHAYLYHALPSDIPVRRLRFGSFWDIRAWWALARVLSTSNPDVVVANLFFSNTVLRLLAPFYRYRVFAVEHNTYTGKTKMHQFLDRLLAPVTERIIAVSKTVAVFTAAQERIAPSKFIVIHNGIDSKKLESELRGSDPLETRHELGIAPEERIIINVARVVPQKNHRLLIEGFDRFAGDHPSYRLLIVGGGSSLEEMKQYARGFDLGNRIQFLGYREDVPRLLGISDFFVSTSLIEGFGIAHAEALACGIPVLTTKTAGPDEMIQEGVNGFFISEYTKESVAAGLGKMAEQDLVMMGAAAKLSAEAYSIGRAVRAYESLFLESMG